LEEQLLAEDCLVEALSQQEVVGCLEGQHLPQCKIHNSLQLVEVFLEILLHLILHKVDYLAHNQHKRHNLAVYLEEDLNNNLSLVNLLPNHSNKIWDNLVCLVNNKTTMPNN
jgi:hypothetical protein